jgi:hypothetical protein
VVFLILNKLDDNINKRYLLVGIITTAFMALFNDLLQDLFAILFPPELASLTKVASAFSAIALGLIILQRYIGKLSPNKQKKSLWDRFWNPDK